MTRDARCKRCGGRYRPGTYGAHTRGLAHQRAIRLDAKLRRKKAREEAAYNAALFAARGNR